MVLCVVSIRISDGDDSDVSVVVTDGWYAVRAVIDTGLRYLVHNGKIFVGQKLRIQGAQLQGAGTGCSPVRFYTKICKCGMCLMNQ